MTDPRVEAPSDASAAPERTRAGSVTRGFLFADLRGYTHFVETHGAAAAADLLTRYRAVVRTSIDRFAGAEIRTEGDSFYVVFTSVSDAVQCGLAIVHDAEARTAELPDEPILVGVGVHAGETIETPEGYVGTPVNIAARLCAIAEPGQVLVSDTVRALTQTVLPVAFSSIGKRQLKGVADPVAVFEAAAADSSAGARDTGRQSVAAGRRRRRRIVIGSVVGVVGVVVVAAGFIVTRPAAAFPAGPWKLGLVTFVSGTGDPDGLTAKAVTLAVDEVNAKGGVGGVPLQLDVRDEVGANGHPDPALGTAAAQAFVADPTILAVVGSRGSPVATTMIPITNAAGLLQCSPTNSNPSLTKPRYGALDLRAAAPTRINYIRVFPSDDIQGPAAAVFAHDDEKATWALVLDDTSAFGRNSADTFVKEFEKLGGTTVRRSLNSGFTPADVTSALTPLSDGPKGASVVYYGGVSNTGGTDLRSAMVREGFADMPFIGTDGLIDGSGSDDGSYVQVTGAAGAGSIATEASIGPLRADFVQRFQARYGMAPDDLAGAAYACTQVILSAIDAVARQGPAAADVREGLRAYAVDTTHRYDTVLGSVGFDSNGDSLQQYVTIWRDDPSAADGKGDWVTVKQQDYGPAP